MNIFKVLGFSQIILNSIFNKASFLTMKLLLAYVGAIFCFVLLSSFSCAKKWPLYIGWKELLKNIIEDIVYGADLNYYSDCNYVYIFSGISQFIMNIIVILTLEIKYVDL